MVFNAFIVDAFGRAIVGGQVSASLRADLAPDAVEMVLHARGSARGLGPSQRSVWPRSAPTRLGSVGDSWDNALAETVNGLDKTELIHRQGRWRTVEQVELAASIVGGFDPATGYAAFFGSWFT